MLHTPRGKRKRARQIGSDFNLRWHVSRSFFCFTEVSIYAVAPDSHTEYEGEGGWAMMAIVSQDEYADFATSSGPGTTQHIQSTIIVLYY